MLEIKKKFLTSDPAGSGLSVLDFEEKGLENARKLLDVLGLPNLLAPKRLVIAKNLISSSNASLQKEILSHFESRKTYLREDKDLVVLFWEGSLPKKTGTLFKFLVEHSKKQNFENLPPVKLRQWILARMKKIDPEARIAESALETLMVLAGNDTWVLDKEIQKLVNFSGGNLIQKEDVELLVKANLESSIFTLIDALAGKNKKEAVKLLYQSLERGEDPFYIFSMIVYQFRNILKVADLKENMRCNEFEIAKLSKLHPFVVKKSISQMKNFSFEKLKSVYKTLGQLDAEAKTGKIDMRLALYKFTAEL